MTEIVKCEVCGEPMPQGETMFKFHGYSGPCPKPPLAKPLAVESKDIKWPEGYCLDPDGKTSIPFGKEEDFNFGYEIGFKEALAIRNSAENAALKEQVAQLEREKEYRYVEQVLRPIRILLKVAECAESLANNSEEMEGEDGRIHVGTAADFDELSDALDLLDELPDDKPGYVLGGAAKAAWALHDIIGDTNG